MKRLFFVVLLISFISSAFAQLPSVSLKDINGNSVNTAELNNDGKPFIIDFFATWCKPCNRELDAIAEVYDEWREETGVKIIAVSIDVAQNVNKVKPLVDNHGWEYDVLLDDDGEFKRAMNVQSVPHSFLLDKEGRIIYNHVGYTDGDEAEVEKKLKVDS